MGLRSNPSYRQRRFGAELRKLREEAGLSSTETAALLAMNQSQLSNVEAGRTGLSPERVRRLAQAAGDGYGALADALVEMGQESGKGWWTEFRQSLGAPLLDLAELEAGAVGLAGYEPMFVPGLLQTRAYASLIHRHGYTRASAEEQEAAVEFRMRRQAILTGERAPRYHAVIHEAALHLSLGAPEVVRDQLLRLIEMSRLPNVTIQVLPLEGPVPFGTGFLVLEPEMPRLGTVLVSHVERDLYLEDETSLGRYRGWFATLSEVALPPVDAGVLPDAHVAKDSLGLIQRLLYPLL